MIFLNRCTTVPGMARYIGHHCFLPHFFSSFTDNVCPSEIVKPDLLTVLSNQLQGNKKTRQLLLSFL